MSEMTVEEQVIAGLVKYGSSERWPTLRLRAEQFFFCECGVTRVKHSDEGRGGYEPELCPQFRARGILK